MRLRSFLLFVPVATAFLYACGATSTESPAGGDEDVVFEGDVTDETFLALQSSLDQGPPGKVPAQAPTLDTPTDGSMLPRAPAPAFTWHTGSAAAQRHGAPHQRWGGLELLPRHAPAEERSPLRELFGPIRSASAHGEPFNGTGTFLVFSVDSDPTLVRVFTGATTYTPSKEVWDKLAGVNKPITLTVVSALFEQDRVVEDGGPFAGSTIKFTVAP
jgi:hypothetical protein